MEISKQCKIWKDQVAVNDESQIASALASFHCKYGKFPFDAEELQIEINEQIMLLMRTDLLRMELYEGSSLN